MCKIRVIHILQSEWFLIKFAAQSWRDFHLAVIYKLRGIPLGRQRGNHRLSKIPLIHQMADARLTVGVRGKPGDKGLLSLENFVFRIRF